MDNSSGSLHRWKTQTPSSYAARSAILAVAPGEAITMWADDDPEQGPHHLGFKLSAEREAVGLAAPDGTTIVGAVVYPRQAPDVSYGRCPMDDDRWRFLHVPTPGQANACYDVILPTVSAQ
jgi:hypothetical protein